MATIGYLRLLFGADTKGLEEGSKRAREEMKKNKEETEKTLGTLKTFGVLAAGGATAGIVALTKSSMDGINATRGLAERIGTSSESLSRLQYAAKLSDVDSETLAGSLEKMQIRLGQVAETGEGKAAKALRSFGLTADELIAKDPVDTFHTLMTVLEGIQNPAERAATAVDLFGKSGAGMLNMVVQGSDALAEMEQEADLLGSTIYDLDAAKVDEADDALTRVWETVSGVGKALAIELAPWITEVATRFTDWAKDGVRAGSLVSQAVDWVTTAVGYAADVVQVLEAAFYAAQGGILKALGAIVQGIGYLGQAIDYVWEKLTGDSAGIADALNTWADTIENMAVGKFAQAGETLGREWAHHTVRSFVEEVGIGAESRAIKAVNQAEKFRGIGSGPEIDRRKESKKEFAGAFEVGTKEAYSAILAARGAIRGDKTQERTAKATERTASATEKMADYIQGLQMMFGVDEGQAIDFLQGV